LKPNFANEFENGLQDPRDLVLVGPGFGSETMLFINSADFNNPNAIPGDGVIDVDGVFLFQLDGTFVEQFVDFTTATIPNIDGPISPGGGVFGPTTDQSDDPDQQSYFVGSRVQGDIIEINPTSGAILGSVKGTEDVAFPRGFVFGPDGSLFLGSGSNPSDGTGDDAILKIDVATGASEVFFSADSSGIPFSPLDVVLSPGGGAIIASSESPFSPGEATPSTVVIIPLDFDSPDDVIVLDPGNDDNGNPLLVDPRGLGIGPNGLLYVSSAGNDTILRFDPFTGTFLDVFATAPGLNGQALNFIPRLEDTTDTAPPIFFPGCAPGMTMASMACLVGLIGYRTSRRRRKQAI